MLQLACGVEYTCTDVLNTEVDTHKQKKVKLY